MLCLDILILASLCSWEDCSPTYCHFSNYLSILFDFNVFFRYSNQFFNFKSFVRNPTFNVLDWCQFQMLLFYVELLLMVLVITSVVSSGLPPSLSSLSTLVVKNKILNFFSTLLIFFGRLNESIFPFIKLSNFVTIIIIVSGTPSSVSTANISENLSFFNEVYSNVWNININLLISWSVIS